jgi:deazaflavin-dependent oxidoreductase (nitroreductase family)
VTDLTTDERRARDEAIVASLRAHEGRPPGDGPALVILHTSGAKTGRTHLKPVCVVEDGDDLVVGGTAGGQPRHPQWYRNLVAHPDLTVEYHGRTWQARAETVPNSVDRDRLFAMLQTVIPDIYGYQDRCRETRQIPVVRLTPA